MFQAGGVRPRYDTHDPDQIVGHNITLPSLDCVTRDLPGFLRMPMMDHHIGAASMDRHRNLHISTTPGAHEQSSNPFLLEPKLKETDAIQYLNQVCNPAWHVRNGRVASF